MSDYLRLSTGDEAGYAALSDQDGVERGRKIPLPPTDELEVRTSK